MIETSKKKKKEARRFRAVALLAEGQGVCEVARLLGVTSGAVSHWKLAYQERGDAGLRSKRHPGAKRRLETPDRRKLPKLLLRGARAHGFSTDLWTLGRVAKVIEREFGIEYHPAHVWKILRGLGWSAQKPERRARERDEQTVAGWRRSKWPHIKKGPRKRS